MIQDMKTIQNKILEIAVYLDDFCKRNGITYYLMGGSALGAMRHKGFIPWDDDFDVFMTYDNYQKFIKVCEAKLDTDRFYLQKENTDEWPLLFSKLRLNGTTFIEEDSVGRNMHKGFYIDIMCLNNTSSNRIFRFTQYLAARLVGTRAIARRGYNTNSMYKKIALKISKVIICRPLFNLLLIYVRSLNSRDCKSIGHFFGRARFVNTSFPKEWLGRPRYVEFENVMLPVPQEVEKYLALRYGDNYMGMPDEKTKALYPSHAIFVDLYKDYKEYDNLQP